MTEPRPSSSTPAPATGCLSARQHDTREWFRALVEQSDELTLVFEASGLITFASRAAADVTGIEPAALVGRDGFGIIHPDDAGIAEAGIARCIAAPDAVERFQLRVRHVSGTWKTVEASLVNLLHVPAVRGLVATCRDITDRVLVEAALSENQRRLGWILEESPSLIYVVRVEPGRIVPEFLSPNIERLLGYTIAEAMDPEFWMAHMHPEDRPRVSHHLGRTLAGATERCGYEYRVQRRHGGWLWVHDQCRIVRDADGCATHLVGACTDLTERKELEAKLLRTQRLESVGRLASGIAHDLNNILSPIMMAASVLPTDSLTLRERDLLATIEANSRRGAALIRQLLAFGRGVEGERVPVQVSHVVREMLRVIIETFPKNVQLDAAGIADVWPVRGDATQLHQVLINLCINARDAMPDGGRLSVSLDNVVLDDGAALDTPGARPGRYVLLRVADTGTGIAPEFLEKIFDPFFTTKPIGEGTGLGLSTTLGIVESHGGCIRVDTKAGEGTVFRVYLPAEDPGVVVAPPQSASFTPCRGDGEMILVVDDEPTVRTIVTDVLQRAGYRVVAAQHGAEAVELYGRYAPSVAAVLLDWLMPVLDGPGALKAMRQRRRDVKVIAMSGFFGETDRAGSVEQVEAILPKPFSPSTLLKVLDDVLRPPRQPSAVRVSAQA